MGRNGGGRDFKPGQSGNPAGRPPTPPEVKALRDKTRSVLDQAKLEAEIVRLLHMPKRRLIAKYKDPRTSGLRRMIIGLILKGDVIAFKALTERVIGKVKTVVEVSGPNGAPIQTKRVSDMTDQEVEDRFKALLQAEVGAC